MTTLADCEALDRADPLRGVRAQFRLPEGTIYLDGNSLGPLTRTAHDRVRAAVEDEWGRELIKAWNTKDWMGMPQRLGARIARLIGAQADEVVVADSTTINLFKLVTAYCRFAAPRRRIVTERGNFPTDLYVLQGIAAACGPAIELCCVPRAELVDAIDENTALVVLSHVHYKSAEVFDLTGLTRRAHAAGAGMLWDLSHTVGALPVDLGAANVDLAVGCTYKYLNGGPGAPAFLYVRRDLQERLGAGIAGWLGHAAPFELSDEYRPAPGMGRHLCGTPGILGMAALDGSLEVFDDIDMQLVRAKSLRLTTLFMDLVDQQCPGAHLTLATPRAAGRRGSHVAYRHEAGYEIMQALIERGVIGDFRSPDLLRFGFSALYTRHADVWEAVAALREVLVSGSWRREEHRVRRRVT